MNDNAWLDLRVTSTAAALGALDIKMQNDDNSRPAKNTSTIVCTPKNSTESVATPNITANIRNTLNNPSTNNDLGQRNEPRLMNCRYKTELCRPHEETGNCKYGDKCQFAHGVTELREIQRHPKYKTELCRSFHTEGFCQYGHRCNFIHNPDDRSMLIKMQQDAMKQLRQSGGGHPGGGRRGHVTTPSATPKPVPIIMPVRQGSPNSTSSSGELSPISASPSSSFQDEYLNFQNVLNNIQSSSPPASERSLSSMSSSSLGSSAGDHFDFSHFCSSPLDQFTQFCSSPGTDVSRNFRLPIFNKLANPDNQPNETYNN